VDIRIPEGDTLPRHVCSVCNIIHYHNPKMVVGCIPKWGNKVLLCRRAINPRRGFWTLPAGFMENAETLAQAAARETMEEANARVKIGNLYAIYDLPNINQVYFLFLAELLDLNFEPGIESLDVKLFKEEEVPWDEMAFRVISIPLKRYFKESRTDQLNFYLDTLENIDR
jgi:ADP-ribose pyrophosphatase YjhB (NUDIX family)